MRIFGVSLNSLEKSWNSFDGLLLMYSDISTLQADNPRLSSLWPSIEGHLKLDSSAASNFTLILCPQAPGSRIILSPIGSIDGDVDDCRRYSESAKKAILKCVSVGIKNPLFAIPTTAASPHLMNTYAKCVHVTLLGLLAGSYVPLQLREHNPASVKNINEIGFYTFSNQTINDSTNSSDILNTVQAIESGRHLARDIGGADPERMAPLRCVHHILESFSGVDNIKITVLTDPNIILKEYPLMHAVARASLTVSRHFPAVVKLEYYAPDPKKVKENLFFIGKGVTYDTGGADIKYGGSMRGMSRDKCGAANCAGFMKTVSLLKPDHVNVITYLGFVRNTSGADNYVSDEIIKSRAGVRVLIGNTDAEGRMVMGDLLAHAKEEALSDTFKNAPSRLFTVATLTGHAIRAMGIGYSISLDNGPAKQSQISKRLFDAGHLIAEPFETSTLRREDYELVKPGSGTEDVIQANDKASTMTNRGHQYPAAFLSVVSGIVNHGINSKFPISYTHVDIAGSAEEGGAGLSLPKVTGSPIAAFTTAFLLNN